MTVNWNRQSFGGGGPDQHPAVAALRRSFPAALLETGWSHGEAWAVVPARDLLEVLGFLRDDPPLLYDFLSDLTALHWPNRKGRAFEVVYQLYSIPGRTRFRVKVPLAEGQDVPTVSGIWPAADWLEREVYDMFGIRFAGHPDPRRILNPDSFEGHPLRKDFPLRGRVRW